MIARFHVEVPDWLELAAPLGRVLGAGDERMRFVLGLARRNLEEGTGGPFAAAVVEIASGRLLGAGVNLVTSAGTSVAHAEVVALVRAQAAAGSWDLAAAGLPAAELVTSTEPCTMCLGAVVWSGVERLVCGARDEDARRIGFDEGPKPERWPDQLAARGIAVERDVLRPEAAAVLDAYLAAGGLLYNPRREGGE